MAKRPPPSRLTEAEECTQQATRIGEILADGLADWYLREVAAGRITPPQTTTVGGS